MPDGELVNKFRLVFYVVCTSWESDGKGAGVILPVSINKVKINTNINRI